MDKRRKGHALTDQDNEAWYLDLFGAIIRQAICDYRQFKNYKQGEKFHAYISAREFIFSPNQLELQLTRYGMNNMLSIDYVRRMAQIEQDTYINPQGHRRIGSEANTIEQSVSIV